LSSEASAAGVDPPPRRRLAAARTRLAAPGVALFLCLFAAQAGVLVLSPILVAVADDLGTSTATAGLLRAVTGLVAGSSAVLLSGLARRFALRDLLLAGAALLALGSALSAAAPSFWLLAVAQVPIGAALAVLLAAGTAGAAEWVAPEHRARVLARALAGQPVAWIVGMPLAGAVAEISWRLAFLTLPLAASLLAAFALSACAAGPPTATAGGRSLELFRDPAVAAWAIGELLAFSAWTGTLVYAGALFVETYATSPTLTGLVLAAAAGAYLPGNFVARRLLGETNRQLLVALALAAAVVVVLFGTVRTSLGISIAIFCTLGFLGGARTLAGSAFGLDALPERRLAIMGIRAAATQYGYLLGAAAGAVALAAADYGALGVVLGSLFALATVPHLLVALRARTP
jgi:predicted MFS family arabinose efflux permease